MDQKIAAEVFKTHVDRLVSHMDQDAFILLSGKEEGSHKPRTKNLYIWLMGYDMIETIFVVTKKSVIYLASQKKLQMIEEIKSKYSSSYNFVFLPKGTSNTELFQKIQNQIQIDSGKSKPTSLALIKEKQSGGLAIEWNEFINNSDIQLEDGSGLVSQLLCVKDAQEVLSIQQSAQLTCYLMKKLIQQIENSIDQSLKVKHDDLAAKIEQLIDSPNEKQRLLTQFKLADGSYEMAFTPIIQSGGEYSLGSHATSNSKYLSTDVILVSCGGQVNVYNTVVSRTLFIDPSERQKKIYNHFYDVQTKVCQSLVPGTRLSDVYQVGLQIWNSKKEELQLPECPANFGQGIGMELRENILQISDKNDRKIEANQTFLVQVGVEALNEASKSQSYALIIADVVLTGEPPQVLTQGVSKQYKNISYQLQDEENEPPKDDKRAPRQNQQEHTGVTTGGRTRGPRNQAIQQQRLNEQQRQQHQAELQVKKQQELMERLERDGFSKEGQQSKSLELNKLTCYRQPEQMPRDAKKGLICVDQARQAILIPYGDTHIPFHVSCIKNVSKIDEGKIGASLRINFFTTETSAGNIQFPQVDGQTIFIKELQCRSRTVARLQDLMAQIKQLQKKVKTEQQVEREKAHVGDTEELILNRTGRKPVFKDLKVRPAIVSGRGTGVLEVHTNGFRYIFNNRETLDILFKNVRHYIYQSPEQEIIAALHFHLVSPIIVGKKKTQDIQFYCEVGGGVEHLEGRKRNNRNDEDEIEDEEKQRQQRKKMHREFEAFIKSVEETAREHKVEFDKPYRELGFEGNWNRARIFLQPTHQTLMNVIEAPFFILTLAEVEIACFERVMPGIKSFDLVFIFKNYDKPVLRLESIDIKDQEGVKNWLDRMNILFFEVGQNLVWKNVLATIQKDIQGFVEDGGWGTVLGESDEEEAEDEDPEAGDSEFSPHSEGSADSDFSEEVDDEDADDDDFDDDDESESDVVDFDNLSEQEDDDEEEEDEQPRKKKGGHSAQKELPKRNPMKKK